MSTGGGQKGTGGGVTADIGFESAVELLCDVDKLNNMQTRACQCCVYSQSTDIVMGNLFKASLLKHDCEAARSN